MSPKYGCECSQGRDSDELFWISDNVLRFTVVYLHQELYFNNAVDEGGVLVGQEGKGG